MTTRRTYREKKREQIDNSYLSQSFDMVVAIDPGTTTGMSIYEKKRNALIWCEQMKIHEAILSIMSIVRKNEALNIHIIVEDARNISGMYSNKMGAGSIRRDCSIWEDYLNDITKKHKNVHTSYLRPTGNRFLKMEAEAWKKYVNWEGKAPGEHARDSATYLFKYFR